MPLLTRQELQSARTELQTRTIQEVEYETSRRWAARAVVAYGTAGHTLDVTRLTEAFGYHQEAVEHAAGASVEWLGQLAAELNSVQATTLEIFERSLLGADANAEPED
jgi:hypothetical protein